MRSMKLYLVLACIAAASGSNTTDNGDKSIVDLAVATPDLSTLVTALKGGKLVNLLSGNVDPRLTFTVFAPTNEAFSKLPPSTLAHLLDPKNIKELDDVLEYHVVQGSVHAKDIKNDEQIKTYEGKSVEAKIAYGHVFINKAEVTTADIEASNGVIHIIDGVLIPPAGPGPPPAPIPASNHLWFRCINQETFPRTENRCGDVDAATRMPASIFEPKHAAQLALYKKITLDTWGETGYHPLELGRCKDIKTRDGGKFTVPDGILKNVDWTEGMFEGSMTAICKKQCNCDFHLNGCRNQTDVPSKNTFCSLCESNGAVNAAIDVNAFTCTPGYACKQIL